MPIINFLFLTQKLARSERSLEPVAGIDWSISGEKLPLYSAAFLYPYINPILFHYPHIFGSETRLVILYK